MNIHELTNECNTKSTQRAQRDLYTSQAYTHHSCAKKKPGGKNFRWKDLELELAQMKDAYATSPTELGNRSIINLIFQLPCMICTWSLFARIHLTSFENFFVIFMNIYGLIWWGI